MTFVLVPGAGGVAWYWHRVAPLLEAAGHHAVAVALRGHTLEGYAKQVVKAVGKRRDVVLVAQSLAGFTAPLVCERLKVKRLVFVNAMIPLPGECVGDWGDETGSSKARLEAARRGGWSTEFDEDTYFFHDVPAPVVRAGEQHDRAQDGRIFDDVCRFEGWPRVPTHVVVGRDDRLFPAAFQRRVARERLGVKADVLGGGHLVALSNPQGLAKKLLGYVRGAPRDG